MLPLPSGIYADPKIISYFVNPSLTDSCDTCQTAILVFGVGSAVVFSTFIKALYQKHNERRRFHAKVVHSGLRSATAFILNNGLLLAASGLVSGILMKSLLHSYSPIEEGANKSVIVSTILHGINHFLSYQVL
ncbi:hypothetical protein CLAVI_000986 [Candidatus Clavichlamydia salmonicola]|uniref:hypothetical protein n=1 Tax=Candidatus Clavichlamydia salmonicola TaxID=469812 RepID=UPI0018913674|nr:hypothetical protein [Candidatus Clavichlamydia salmonicola]MBF5051343.1 hypothetical protein [Candidatus Clavichlamydia salmonicola]